MKTGSELISEERQRQIEKEGFTPGHDDDSFHDEGQLARAAVCYASPVLIFEVDDGGKSIIFNDPWPQDWDLEWDKRRTEPYGHILANENLSGVERVRNLVKAGALIAAEIDRLQRIKG